jgi:hypothetical protein
MVMVSEIDAALALSSNETSVQAFGASRITALETERDGANQRCKELGCTMEREFIKFEKRISELLETQAEYDKKITRDEERLAALEAERDRLRIIAELLAEALEADRGWLAVETPASVLRQSTAVLKMWHDARAALAEELKP